MSKSAEVKTRLSIQAAHEQINPIDLLDDVIYLDKKGIERCWTSDHYMPWWDTGASGGLHGHGWELP